MKNFLAWSLAVSVVVGLSSDLYARGGRGPGGGGAARGNVGGPQRSIGNAERGPANNAGQRQINPSNQAGKLQSGNVQNKASQAKSNFADASKPFTAGWYANHPGGWQYTHPHADAWAVAGFAGAAAWLGLGAAGGDTAVASETVTTADTSDDNTDDDSADEQQSTSDAAAANALAKNGATTNNDSASYLPLGVFALAPKNQKEAAALVQIAVSKEGVVRGSYYDLLTDQGHTIQGAVDKKTERVAFTIGERGKTVFETKLADLTQASGEASLHFTDGQATDWTLSRFDADPSTVDQK